MRTYEHIAYLLIYMLKASEKARFRLSRKSLQSISGRSVIKSALIKNIGEWMEGTAVILPLNRGGYVIVSQESLEGIAPLKIADVIPNWRKLDIEFLKDQVDAMEDEGDE
ncbi:hypothetical protein AA0242T_1935 [Acetobacter aceti NRIC 0242]|uniref:Uncharacterized protein n=1 Tax=Acetobacter aceti NBRC 14818 TaxID=887700 RepID=A0AB33IDZ1_ACEAC|nr:hypothetical protein [Acetobacter aceti]TCS27518.1 hypothetical protein EDC15_12518 [Acetobacter aceti NBRC 14818]BCK75956.1 hypothetical protein EMQ_1562 [Acetobacter aceti NBRC 14818]GAN58854.1 hypothetical protein Abac_086_020 [Acetobacter aceti NBRC 14818]GBO81233.1 hypothetical protein AA0242T_1935 [Acetobacter aceti NRIC 0242]